MQESAPAKINLFLEILGRRPDGYHEISTVMQTLSLEDVLEAESSEGVSVEVSGLEIPPGGENLVVKAARLLAEEAGVLKGARFRLEKRIPAGAGLGGGSSDAAAALRLLNRLWNLGASNGDLSAVAGKVGSDVPFFMSGGTALCTGRGERVEPLPSLAPLEVLLAWPGIALPTKSVYGGLVLPKEIRDTDAFIRHLHSGDVEGIRSGMFNRLEAPARRICPALEEVFRRMPPGSRMSGSGSACFALGGGELHAIPRDWKVFHTATSP